MKSQPPTIDDIRIAVSDRERKLEAAQRSGNRRMIAFASVSYLKPKPRLKRRNNERNHMHISVTSSGSVCKLSKTDESRISEVIKLCDAICRHSEDEILKEPARHSRNALERLTAMLKPPAVAGTTQEKAAS